MTLEVDSAEFIKGPFPPYFGTGMDKITLTDLRENKLYTATVIAQYKPGIFSVSENITICESIDNLIS